MLARAAFYPTLLYNVAMERLTAREWYTRIDDTVILGALPFRSMTDQLVKSEGVRAVITMNEEYELKHFVNTKQEWAAVGVEQLHLSTEDLLAAPSQDALRRGAALALQYHREHKGSVYVHCKAGRTRSASVVAAYLIELHGWDVETAVAFIKSKRPHTSIRQPQMEALQMYHRDRVK